MSREEKIKRLIELIDFVEGVKLPIEYFKDYSDDKIESKIELYDYVADK